MALDFWGWTAKVSELNRRVVKHRGPVVCSRQLASGRNEAGTAARSHPYRRSGDLRPSYAANVGRAFVGVSQDYTGSSAC